MAKPTRITAGMLRLATLSAFVVAVGMIRTRLTPDDGWILVGVGAALVVVGAAAALGLTRRIEERLKVHSVGEAVLVLVRRTGLPLLGLAFFLFWTLVYVGALGVPPGEAFTGLGPHPRFADFFYYAVCTAFISPPGDILAHSRGARSATMIEMLTAFALLTAYLSSFVDWNRREPPVAEPGTRVAGSSPRQHLGEVLVAAAREADEHQLLLAATTRARRALVVESLAAAVAGVVDQLRAIQPVEELVVVGGGAASPFVRERIAEHAAARVIAGSAEATALGNALVQGIALGAFRDLDDARSWASRSSAAR